MAATAFRRRSQGRMLALQALCLHEAIGESFAEQLGAFLTDSHTFVDLGFDRAPPADVLTFARRLAEGTWRARQHCDELLTRAATQWSLSRMPPIDRNILRMGVYELLEEPDTPPEVAINEAIDLARRFGDADSAAFVNGVLDATWRQLKAAGGSENPESCHGSL